MSEANDIKILKELLNKQMIVEFQERKVTLTEEKAKDSSITITGLPDNTIIISVDEAYMTRRPGPAEIKKNQGNKEACKSSNEVFRGPDGVNRTADYIIVDTMNRVLTFIEMKRTTCKREHIIQQLTGAKCFMDCCKLYANAFMQSNVEIDLSDFLNNYRSRFWAFKHTHKSLSKDGSRRLRTTGIKRQSVPDIPERALDLSDRPTVDYKYLAYLKENL